jgi:hypothetical protein
MKKNLLSLLVVFSFGAGLLAQENDANKQFFFDFGLGGSMHSFQDTKYSDVRYNGIGVTTNIDFTWQRNHIIAFGVDGYYEKDKPQTFDDDVSVSEYDFMLYVKYLYPIIKNKKYKLYIGGRIDAYELSTRTNMVLENNSIYLINGINFKALTMYERKLNGSWILNADFGLQLFSFMNEYMSFAYAADQITLENGDYNYEYPEAPIRFTPLWDYLNIQTNVRFQYGKRWIFGYTWRMQQSYAVEDYRMTKGYSALSITYRIVNKSK